MEMRKLRCWHVTVVFLLLAGWLALAQAATPNFPKLTGRVVDDAHMISPQAQAKLTAMLAGLEQENGDQIVVVTLKNLGGHTIENYGYQLGRHWGIGQKGKDNGALLIVAKKEHKIRIEVGYGLEGQLTDAKSSIIIRQIIEPAFKKGNFDAGILEGTAAMVQLLGGKPPSELIKQASQRMKQGQAHGISLGRALMFFILMIAITGFFGGRGGRGHGMRIFGLPLFLMAAGGGMGGPRGGGGFGGGFGGFSGGGGGFGGGGASGGW